MACPVNKEIESLKSFELEDGCSFCDDQITGTKTKLLHHLVDLSKVFQETSAGSLNELAKQNNELINELLKSPIKPIKAGNQKAPAAAIKKSTTTQSSWREMLMTKLVDAQVELENELVKAYVDEKLDAAAQNIDALADELLNNAQSILKTEGKVTLMVNARSDAIARVPDSKCIYLKDLKFTLKITPSPVDLEITCDRIPPNMSCKTRIEATLKCQNGGKDSVRIFCKTFEDVYKKWRVMDFVRNEECDPALGFLKNDFLIVEVAIHIDELEQKKAYAIPTVQRVVPAIDPALAKEFEEFLKLKMNKPKDEPKSEQKGEQKGEESKKPAEAGKEPATN